MNKATLKNLHGILSSYEEYLANKHIPALYDSPEVEAVQEVMMHLEELVKNYDKANPPTPSFQA